MLVLSRKLGEEVVINGNITLKITDLGSGQVRLGFTAPRDVSIDRAEIHAAKNEFEVEVETPVVAPTEKVTPRRHPAINRIRRHLSTKASRGQR